MKLIFGMSARKSLGFLTMLAFMFFGTTAFGQTAVDREVAVDRLEVTIQSALEELDNFNPATSPLTLDEVRVKAKFCILALDDLREREEVQTYVNELNARMNSYLTSVSPNINVSISGINMVKEEIQAVLTTPATQSLN